MTRVDRIVRAACGITLGLQLLITALSAAEPDPASNAKGIEFFETRVRPVLARRCFECHQGEAPDGELQLDSLAGLLTGGSRGPAIVPGKPEQSLLLSAIKHGELLQMPPKEKLPAAVIADFAEWVKLGAPWPDSAPVAVQAKGPAGPLFTAADHEFWSFRPPVDAPLPAVSNEGWIRNPIDRFILSELDRAGLQPAAQADKRTLIRRATFDLTGLPPTPQEVADFLADDSDMAYGRLIDRLLASPHYGERWGRHWLDVARYADSNGMDENLAFASAFRYRDYVIQALNFDKPYDRFLHEQLAGDLLPATPGETEAELHQRWIATGFLAIGPKMLADDDPRKKEMDIIDEQLDTTCRALMGLTLGCARCHDHKFDPIPTADYYSLAGIFKSTKTMENFGVVASWHEYSLLTPALQAQLAAHDERMKTQELLLKSRVEAAQQEFLAGERAKAGQYLAAALPFVQTGGIAAADGSFSVGALLDAQTSEPRALVREAEDFQRGSLEIDRTNWGKEIGVLLQGGFAEYDFEFPTAGRYQLELRYAAAESRPVTLHVNGKLVNKEAAREITGGWYPANQAWYLEGVAEFTAGKNVVRLERGGAVPHIDKLLLFKLPDLTPADKVQSVLAGRDLAAVSGAIVVEAEAYARGTISKRNPVIQNAGNNEFLNEAEYDVTIPAAGNYQLELLYACGGGRKFQLSIDGQIVKPAAANQATGGFGDDQVKWFAEGVYNLPAGQVTIRIEERGPTPHLDKLALIPTELAPTYLLAARTAGARNPAELARELKLNETLLRQWISHLQSHRGPGSLQALVAKLAAATPDYGAAQWQVLFDRAAEAWQQLQATEAGRATKQLPDAELEPFRAALVDPAGPFRLPGQPERFYTADAAAAIKTLEKEKQELTAARPAVPQAIGVREGQPQNVRVHLRGEHTTLGAEVPRRFLRIIAGEEQPALDAAASGRLQFAQWLTSPDHPLTSRVMVNRLWQGHFGTGIVRTSDNFGRLGELPSNQPLLDWLAREFLRQNWSLKAMHRLMMLSNTYQMSTAYSAAGDAADPENRLWWRMNRRRLSAEEVRDAIHVVGGSLDLAVGGQLMKDKNRDYITGTGSRTHNYDTPRRSVYLPVFRSAVYEVFQAFDFADPSVLNGKRETTTVTPQALFMMNSDIVARNATAMSRRLLADANTDDAGRIRTAFETALSRPPTEAEVARFITFANDLEKQYLAEGRSSEESRLAAWRSACRVLIASSEFVYVE